MTDRLRAALTGIIDRVLAASRDDARLRHDLRAVAEELTLLTADEERQGEPIQGPALPEAGDVAGLPPAELGDVSAAEPPVPTATAQIADDTEEDALPLVSGGLADWLGQDADVPALTDHLWLKAEAARWAAERQRLLANRASFRLEVAPHDRALVARGKAAGCYLWMLHPRCRRPASVDDFDLIAACYETVAEAVAMAHLVLSHDTAHPHEVEGSLTLLAEAQSALWVAVAGCGGYADEDQQRLFTALQDIADERRIFIAKGLKRNKPVDPSDWAAIAGRVHDLHERFIVDPENWTTSRTPLMGGLIVVGSGGRE